MKDRQVVLWALFSDNKNVLNLALVTFAHIYEYAKKKKPIELYILKCMDYVVFKLYPNKAVYNNEMTFTILGSVYSREGQLSSKLCSCFHHLSWPPPMDLLCEQLPPLLPITGAEILSLILCFQIRRASIST